VPRFTEQVFYQLYQQGLTPIIAHPERNRAIQENPDLLYDLVEKGALAQLTASSLNGSFGKKVEKLSHQLIDANLIHLIASDAHGVKSRKFRLKEAYEVLEKKYGWTLVEEFKDNAQMILENRAVRTWEPERVKRKKLLGIF
jgi:protein-tyrosine phosphatase